MRVSPEATVERPASEIVRGTQSFVRTLTWSWRRPSLTALEVLWRWVFGIPTLWLLYRQGMRILDSVPWRLTGLPQLTIGHLLTDPMSGSETLANAIAIFAPPVLETMKWLAPTLLLVWAAVSSVGRTLVLRRMRPDLHSRPGTFFILQLLRLIPLAGSFVVWWLGLRAIANFAVMRPIDAGAEPNMILYFGLAIVLTLALFVLWAAVSWVFSIAPLLAMLRNLNFVQSLRASLNIGSLRSTMVEINLVMGIVKIALLVLAVVFSACPVPFSAQLTDDMLMYWNFGVAVWYFLVSDFFHVTRLASYLHLWQHNATER